MIYSILGCILHSPFNVSRGFMGLRIDLIDLSSLHFTLVFEESSQVPAENHYFRALKEDESVKKNDSR